MWLLHYFLFIKTRDDINYLSVRLVHELQEGKAPRHLDGGYRVRSSNLAKVEVNHKQIKRKSLRGRIEIHCRIWSYLLTGAPMSDSAKRRRLERFWLAMDRWTRKNYVMPTYTHPSHTLGLNVMYGKYMFHLYFTTYNYDLVKRLSREIHSKKKLVV